MSLFAGRKIASWHEPYQFRKLHRRMGQPRPLSVALGFWFLLIYVVLSLLLLAIHYAVPPLSVTLEHIAIVPPSVAAIVTVIVFLKAFLAPPMVYLCAHKFIRRARSFNRAWDITWIGGWDVIETETVVGKLRMLVLVHKTEGYLFFGLPQKMTEEKLEKAFAVHGIVRETMKLDEKRFFYPSSKGRRKWR